MNTEECGSHGRKFDPVCPRCRYLKREAQNLTGVEPQTAEQIVTAYINTTGKLFAPWEVARLESFMRWYLKL